MPDLVLGFAVGFLVAVYVFAPAIVNDFRRMIGSAKYVARRPDA